MVHDSHKIPVLTANTDIKDNSLAQNNQNILMFFLNKMLIINVLHICMF